MKFLVVGGTGLVGSTVVETLKQKGHDVIAASPSTGINSVTGDGLREALTGTDVVIDVSNSPSFEDEAAMTFFETSGKNLAAAEAAAGVRHHVALLIVGTDQMQDSGYFRAKLAQEQLVRTSAIPYSLLAATQFFEFVRTIAFVSTEGHTVSLPPALIQPMAASDVANAVAEMALGDPINYIVEIAGPEVFVLHELVHRVLEYDGDTRKVVTDPSATYFGVKVSERMMLPGGATPHLGTVTLDWWLEHTAPPPGA
jgi:uncharacterized protein YbjT (DUF2867 family)